MTIRAQDIPLMAGRHRHILVLRPMKINTDYLDRSIETVENAFGLLRQQEPEEVSYRISRSACVKEFETIEELSGSLLKKRLRGYFASNREADSLYFRDIFRQEPIPAGKLSELMDVLRDSTLPFLVEAHDWARLPKSFREEIERSYVSLMSE